MYLGPEADTGEKNVSSQSDDRDLLSDLGISCPGSCVWESSL